MFFLIIFSTFVLQVNATDIDIQYNSLYVSEGRNNLNEGGIVWLSSSTEINENLYVGLVYGRSTNSNPDFDEFNLTLTYSDTIGDFDWYVGLNRLEFFQDNAHDNEVGAGVSYSGYKVTNIFADATYSTEANGSFVEIGVDYPVNLAPNIDVTPYALVGFDFGYASDQHDGFNHFVTGAQLDFFYSDDITVFFKVELHHAGSDIRRDTGKSENEAWFGVGIASSF